MGPLLLLPICFYKLENGRFVEGERADPASHPFIEIWYDGSRHNDDIPIPVLLSDGEHAIPHPEKDVDEIFYKKFRKHEVLADYIEDANLIARIMLTFIIEKDLL